MQTIKCTLLKSESAKKPGYLYFIFSVKNPFIQRKLLRKKLLEHIFVI